MGPAFQRGSSFPVPQTQAMGDNLGSSRGQHGAVGQAHPIEVFSALAGAQGHSTGNPAAHSCTSSVLRAANCSYSISCDGVTSKVTPWGQNAPRADICHRTSPLCQPGRVEKCRSKGVAITGIPMVWVLTQPWLLLPHSCGILPVNLCFTRW